MQNTSKSPSTFITFKITSLAIGLLFSLQSFGQTQRGNNIPGENAQDQSGHAVSLGDANTVAIGAPQNIGSSAVAGHVRVFQWIGNSWQQKGIDIDGANSGDNFGSAVSMPNADRLAIGAPGAGQATVFRWTGSNWSIVGGPFNGRTTNDQFGTDVYMPNANVVAIGAPNQNYVRVYAYNGLTWSRRGLDINGSSGEYFGTSVAMANSFTLAVGAQKPSTAGVARVFRWDGVRWSQKGSDILGENSNDRFGSSISMPTENTVAIGAPLNDQHGTASGHVRVYDWNGTSWVQRGSDIDGDTTMNLFGSSVSLQDSLTLAVGAPRANGDTTESGIVRILRWNGSSWIQHGLDISGEGAFHRSGGSISMRQEAIAIGSPYSDEGGPLSGHASVYDSCATSLDTSVLFQLPPVLTSNLAGAAYQWLDCNNGYAEISGANLQYFIPHIAGDYAVEVRVGNCADTSACYNVTAVSIQENAFENKVTIYPNPTTGKFQIDFGDEVKILEIVIRNILGEEVLRTKTTTANNYELEIRGEAGLYFIELIDQSSNSRRYKVMKK